MRSKTGDVIEWVCVIGMLAVVAIGAMVLGLNANARMPPHCGECPDICDFVVKAAGPFLWFVTLGQALLMIWHRQRRAGAVTD